jgi:hypothetical protein
MDPRPRFPHAADRERIESQGKRLAMLLDLPGLDDLVAQWIDAYIDKERQAQWGPPDTSVVTIADIARQLTTPGAYGAEPALTLPVGGEVVRDALSDSGTWQLLQMALYCSFGVGSYVTHHAWDADAGRLVTRLVSPSDCWARVHPADPTRPVAMYELRAMADAAGQHFWAWCVSSIENLDAPFKRVYRYDEKADLGLGADITREVYGATYEGADYPLRDSSNRPLLDYIVRRHRETGDLWAWQPMRGAFRGALNSMVYATLMNYAMRDASASSVIIVGVAPPMSSAMPTIDGGSVARISIHPGQMTFLQPNPESKAQPLVVPIGAGMALKDIGAAANQYEQSQLARFGVARDDVTRSSQNPTSGAALSISNAEKREAMKLAQPVLRRADLQMVRVVAAVLRSAGIPAPDEGYAITYAEIPLGANEMRAQSEQIDARIKRGTASRVDAYLLENPGITREQAIEALRRIRAEEMLIEGEAPEAEVEEPEPQPPEPETDVEADPETEEEPLPGVETPEESA